MSITVIIGLKNGENRLASYELRNRANWQTISGRLALDTEELFFSVMQDALESVFPGQFLIERHPKDFASIYSDFELNEDIKSKIYNIDVSAVQKNGTPKYSWGISMDFAIRNKKNNKTLFGEIKRQDGWVETTNMSAGRGNAHERSCKYLTPGLLNIIRQKSNISEEILPFWIVFVGDITRDPRRNREIAFWYQGYESNYFMWRDKNNPAELLDFFEGKLLKFLLDK